MSRRISTVPTVIKPRLLQGRRSMMRTMIPPSFRRILNLRMHNNPRNYRRSSVNQRHRNREATIAHVNGRLTIDLIFARLSTKSFVEKSRGPLLQPEVHAVQMTILNHAAHSRSSHAGHYITPQLFTQPISPKAVSQAENVVRQQHKQVLQQGHYRVPGQVPKQEHQ